MHCPLPFVLVLLAPVSPVDLTWLHGPAASNRRLAKAPRFGVEGPLRVTPQEGFVVEQLPTVPIDMPDAAAGGDGSVELASAAPVSATRSGPIEAWGSSATLVDAQARPPLVAAPQ